MIFSKLLESVCCKLNKFNPQLAVKFMAGELYDTLISTLKERAPYSKVVVFATEKSYIHYAKPLNVCLKNNFIKPTFIVSKKFTRASVDEFNKFFSISEDVRFLIITDLDLLELGLYFASVRNIPCFILVESFSVDGLLLDRLNIDNGKIADEYHLNCDRYIFLDADKIIATNPNQAIAKIGAFIPALLDYKVNSVMKGEPENQLIYFVVDKAVQFLLQKFNCQDKEDLIELLYYALAIEFLRTVDGGAIYNSFGALKTATLAFKDSLPCSVDKFYCAKQVLSFYCEKIADKNCEPFYNDYNAIATTISCKERKDFVTVAKQIIDKVNFINDNRAVAVRLIELIEKQVMLASKSFSEVYKIFRLNSDKKTYSKKSIKKYLTLCGYSGEQINLMTLLTETK